MSDEIPISPGNPTGGYGVNDLRSLPSSTGSAEDRGMAMMVIPMKDLPPLALEFAKHLCRELGMCGEVLLTAWTVYAQCVENLPCKDSNYQARPGDIEWFKQRSTLTPNAGDKV